MKKRLTNADNVGHGWAAARRRLIHRLGVVRRYEAALSAAFLAGVGKVEATKAFLAGLPAAGRPSKSTLYNWTRAWRTDGELGLMDARSFRRSPAAEFLTYLAGLYRGPGLMPFEVCHELAQRAAEVRGWPVATLRESRAFLKLHVLPELKKGGAGK